MVICYTESYYSFPASLLQIIPWKAKACYYQKEYHLKRSELILCLVRIDSLLKMWRLQKMMDNINYIMIAGTPILPHSRLQDGRHSPFGLMSCPCEMLPYHTHPSQRRNRKIFVIRLIGLWIIQSIVSFVTCSYLEKCKNWGNFIKCAIR